MTQANTSNPAAKTRKTHILRRWLQRHPAIEFEQALVRFILSLLVFTYLVTNSLATYNQPILFQMGLFLVYTIVIITSILIKPARSTFKL